MPVAKPLERAGSSRPDSYEKEFYAWTINQAAALREKRVAALDLDHFAEEIEDLGKEQFSKLESASRLILLRISKWDRQPERRSRSCSRSRALTIEREREQYERVLRNNPGLKPRQGESLKSAYGYARLEAMDETGLPRTAFPQERSYNLKDVMNRPIEWP